MNNNKMSWEKLLKFILSCFVIPFWFLLSFSALAVHADVIIDNGNAGTSYTGSWGVSGATNPYGTNSVWSRDGDTYSWQMSSQPAGVYEVYMWWSGYSSRATNISVAINHATGTQTTTINQQQNAGQWNSLGQYSFNTTGKVTITAANGSTVSTCADAVWFKLISADTPAEVIIDNRDAATSKTGTWGVSGATGFWGLDSVWARNGATFTWIFTPPQNGNYEVSMWWTQYSSRSNNIPVDIENSGGTTRVYINQQLNGGQWNVFGTYPFTTGSSYRVTITSQPDPSSTCADAVKFTYISGEVNTPPVAVIDSISPNPALPGDEVTFEGHGTDSDGDAIAGYNWRSSEDGFLSDSDTFSIENLSEGIHIIYFSVQDDDGAWSPEVSVVIGHLGCDSPIRIMPLGDSITYGTGEISSSELITGYRQPLYLSLADAGYYGDFAGSMHTGELATPLFDYEHEGHGGWRDDQVADYIYQWLVNNPADVILLHIGTNEPDPDPSDVEDILNEIDRYSDDLTVVLARIINQKTPSPTVTAFNDNIQAMAENRIANGDKIIIVDQEHALTYPDDMLDNVHPNDSGYNKMAAVWLDALDNFLPVCEQFPASIISATAGAGGSISPSGALPVHYGADQTFSSITPNTGYHIVDVLVDGGSEGAITSYTFSDVITNHTIHATFASDVLPQGVIIDNGAPGTSSTGTWGISGGTSPYGADSLWARNGATYTWQFNSQPAGVYEVFMWWSGYSTRATNIAVNIYHRDGVQTVNINQQQNAGQWNSLGQYYFNTTGRVTITAANGSTVSTCADAVRFVLMP